jgi:hypothetical protein
MHRHLAPLGLTLLLLAACSNTTPPAPTAIPGAQVAVTAAPALPGTVIPTMAPRLNPNPAETPVIVTGLTVGPDGHEIVSIANISETDQPIGLWSVFNERTGAHFDFPADFVLKPQQVVKVHSGPGAVNNPPGDLLWSTERQWTGDQEDVILLNRPGAVMYRFVADLRK